MINKKILLKKLLKDENKKLSGKVVTKIIIIKNYCPAEEYHQRYLRKKIKCLWSETVWLENNIDKVKIIRLFMAYAQTKRNGYEEYKKNISQIVFFLI